MIRYLIKNNFKLMLRNKWSLVIMVLGPILVIAILASAFQGLLQSYEGVEEFRIGYRVAEESMIYDSMSVVKEAGGESGIIFYEYPEGEPKALIENNNLAGFVEFSGDDYTLYKSGDHETEGIALEYFLSKVMGESVKTVLQMTTMVPGAGQAEYPDAAAELLLPVKELEHIGTVDSKDYYGIVYIIYFSWCGMLCATGVLSNEKKYGIEKKFRVSALTEAKLYLSRLLPLVLTVAVGMGLAIGSTVLMYDIHWGTPLLSLFLVFLMILAGSAYGMMLYSISNNMVITIIVLFTSVWFMGFFGGCFETYMFSSVSEMAKHMSPIYHGNRALVELSCMGHSDYVGSAIVYSLGIFVVCSAIAVAVGCLRKRGKA